jgi:hypothetical protein
MIISIDEIRNKSFKHFQLIFKQEMKNIAAIIHQQFEQKLSFLIFDDTKANTLKQNDFQQFLNKLKLISYVSIEKSNLIPTQIQNSRLLLNDNSQFQFQVKFGSLQRRISIIGCEYQYSVSTHSQTQAQAQATKSQSNENNDNHNHNSNSNNNNAISDEEDSKQEQEQIHFSNHNQFQFQNPFTFSSINHQTLSVPISNIELKTHPQLFAFQIRFKYQMKQNPRIRFNAHKFTQTPNIEIAAAKKILLIKQDTTHELAPNIEHVYDGIILNRGSTLTTIDNNAAQQLLLKCNGNVLADPSAGVSQRRKHWKTQCF